MLDDFADEPNLEQMFKYKIFFKTNLVVKLFVV